MVSLSRQVQPTERQGKGDTPRNAISFTLPRNSLHFLRDIIFQGYAQEGVLVTLHKTTHREIPRDTSPKFCNLLSLKLPQNTYFPD